MNKSDALATWAELGRSQTVAILKPSPSWDAVNRIIAVAHPKLRADAKDLKRLLQKSRTLLHPLEDPLEVDLGMHRWLAEDREEAYSDWLQWVLYQVEKPELVFDMFRISPPPDISTWNTSPDITPEVPTDHGHEGQAGRLDLVIRYPKHAVIVVEVKKGGADDADTEKHQGYCESLKDFDVPRKNVHCILLASDGEETDYDGFRLVRWEQLCIFLRRLAARKPALRKCVTLALVLAFVGAVEQNLLGFNAEHIRRVVDGKAILRLPRILDHLEASLIDEKG